MIWVFAVIAVVLSVGMLRWMSGARAQAMHVDRAQINREALSDGLDDIERRRERGDIDEDTAQSMVQELGARLEPDAAANADMPQGIDVRIWWLVAAAFAMAIAAYALDGSWRTAERVELASTHPELMPKLRLEHLREYVRRNPDDATAWAVLGDAETMDANYTAAADALAKANALAATPSADWLVSEGEALAMLNERDLSGRPVQLFEQALALDQQHPRALWFLALASLQNGRDQQARDYWQRMIALENIPAHVREMLEKRIAEMGVEAPHAGVPAAAETAPAGGPKLLLRITLEDGSPVPDGGVLFVFARPAGQTSGPPLAVQRLANVVFPVSVTLDDSNAMMPGRTISAHRAWTVSARLSASGSVDAGAGDLEATADINDEMLDEPLVLQLRTR